MTALMSQSACAHDDSVYAVVEIVGGATQALAIGELIAVHGTYSDCAQRTGAWSVNVDGSVPTDELSVVVKNTGCVLTLTHLSTTGGLLPAMPMFALTASYQPMASAFGSSPVQFYANVKLSSVGFANDFVLNVLFSESTSATRGISAQLVPPTVTPTPPDGSMNRSIATQPTATFNQPMNPATLTGSTFTLTQGMTPIAGMVSFDVGTNTATFTPTDLLGLLLTYTATITTGARTTRNSGLAMDYVWTFTTAQFSEGPVNLGTAAGYSVLSSAGLTNTGASSVTGKVGSGTLVTGFPPGTTATPPVHTADADTTAALADLATAYADAAGRTPVPGNSIVGDIGGTTKTPGLYTAAATMGITGILTLDAQFDSAAIFIFQIGTMLTTGTSAQVVLINGALASNVYWQVGSSATLGTGTAFQGTILADQSVTLTTNVTVVGRVLARAAAVTMDTNMVTGP